MRRVVCLTVVAIVIAPDWDGRVAIVCQRRVTTAIGAEGAEPLGSSLMGLRPVSASRRPTDSQKNGTKTREGGEVWMQRGEYCTMGLEQGGPGAWLGLC